jgi:protein-disulfide isomerase
MDTPTNSQKNMTPMAVVLGAIIIAGAIMYSKGPVAAPSAANQQAAAPKVSTAPAASAAPAANVNVKDVTSDNEPFIGAANAPAVLAYWSDYQCPFCKQFETTTMQQLMDTYVKTNKLRIIFKDFSFLGDDSQTGALVARAVWENYPNQYFAWREAMFNKQDGENSGFGDMASVIDVTKTISGIDANKISQLVTANKDKYQKEIDADKAEGSKFGIHGTPGFITGTQLISGAVPLANFQSAIDAQLK